MNIEERIKAISAHKPDTRIFYDEDWFNIVISGYDKFRDDLVKREQEIYFGYTLEEALSKAENYYK